MNTRIKFLPLLIAALGLAAPAAKAQQLPVLSVALTEIDINGTPAYGSNVYAASGTTLIGPTTSANAGNGFVVQQLNGGNAAYGSTLTLWAIATGTYPVSGFTYTFYVNGVAIGNAAQSPIAGYDYGIGWTPPQPGVYYFSVVASDGQHTAQSLAIEFYVYGIDIVSPVANTQLPIGSSVVLEVATSLNIGAVSNVDFYQGVPPNNVLLGSSRTYPYSIIYTPPAVNPVTNTNLINFYAVSYAANGSIAFTAPTQTVTMIPAVGPLPLCTISTPAGTPSAPSTIPIPNYVADNTAFIPIIVNASAPQGKITQVQLYINGVLYGSSNTYPYSFEWTPTVTGVYNITALAYDDKDNVIASTTSTAPTLTPQPTQVIVGSLPSVAIVSPSDGATLNGTTTVTASATDTNTNSSGVAVPISNVQFILDNNVVGSVTTPTQPGGNQYSLTFTPVQNIDPVTGDILPSQLSASATDALGFTGTSAVLTVQVKLGGTTISPVVGTPPTISLITPANNSSFVVNTPVTLSATAAATNTPGNVASVTFLVDNKTLNSISAFPYSVTWTPTNLGTYTISASVTDNNGNVTNSSPVTVTVVTEPPPTVTVTSPEVGSTATVSTPVTVNASASSPSGTITGVQFYENGLPVGAVSTTQPYTATFTPLSAGVYTLTAIATDNAGDTTTSSPVVIEALPTQGGLGTSTYFGQYQGLTEGGRFAYIVIDGTYGTYIGHATSGTGQKTAFYPGIPVTSSGNFTGSSLSGIASSTGVNGTLSPSNDLFIGAATQAGTNAVASGYYTGSISGQPNSQVTAIVGTDGSLMAYISEGGTSDVADGTVDGSGNFTITTVGNNTFTGNVGPSTGFMTGTLSGSIGGSVVAARASGGLFSDGVLKNLSTRGQVGSGANTMITGFVVSGTSSKNLLIRAIGPTLSSFGLSGAVAGTQLQVYSGSTLIASNSGWSSTATNASQVNAADAASGAFALPANSADSAIVGSFAPGLYTAQVTGTSGSTGIALAEVYDLDGYTPFTTKKLVNVSTRGNVGTGTSVLIGGFSISGTAPKKLLIRGAGPALATLNVSNALSAAHLQLFNSSGALVRENYSWQVGNDAALVSAAESSSGAFAFANNSDDAALLIVLPPGNYTAELSGANSATGNALVEVYEVP